MMDFMNVLIDESVQPHSISHVQLHYIDGTPTYSVLQSATSIKISQQST